MSHEEAIKKIIAAIDSQERNYCPAITGYAEIRAPLVELAETVRKTAAEVGVVVAPTERP